MYKLWRIFKFAIQGFFRNFWLSLVTITMMLMAIVSVTLLVSIDYVKQATIAGVEQKVDILISMQYEIEREDVDTLVLDLEELPEVKKVRIISPEDNMELFKQNNSNSKAIKALDVFEDDENPFGYSLAIQAYNLDQYKTISAFIEKEEYAGIVKASTFHDYESFVNKINNLSKILNKYSWYIIAIFAVISLVVIFNTIRMSIYTRKDEIVIMKLVGAGNWFIRAPFFIESIFYALVSVLIVIGVTYPIVNFIQPSLTNYFQDTQVINLAGYFQSNFLYIFGWQFLALATLNVVSTAVAMKKYLKS
ncbi:FtsX-like permease family protein [Candidatus Parcubacteria bacterium]|jgi:cell division transport system permease protein|nr:FtsX-like permease family protein [Candidatus Parcubacteria bacterium]MBT7228850.1 FtsX-like permease family protein [Candidatus Parcubacteria bacterium]